MLSRHQRTIRPPLRDDIAPDGGGERRGEVEAIVYRTLLFVEYEAK